MRVTYRQRTQIKKLAQWIIGIVVIWIIVSFNYSRKRPTNDDEDSQDEKVAKMVEEMVKKMPLRGKERGFDYYSDNDNDNETFLEEPDMNIGENPGELGNPVKLPENLSEEMKLLIREGYRKHHFNQYVSDLISVRRKLPDYRTRYCWEASYKPNLPSTSIIITFHNEAWSALLRTVHSVLDRSPEHLIEEILLIDDDSDMAHLKKQLDEYMASYPKVRIIRNDRREGLIKSRMIGVEQAKAKIVTFLDSHCETTPGWLEPLLDRVASNPNTIAAPVNDIINVDNLAYNYALNNYIGGFTWSLHFTWHLIPEREKVKRLDQSEPFATPAIAGGIYTMNKHFFEALGMYDSGFDVWGAENFELSFKAWMCGGRVEILPCSHVGHIFKKRPPYNSVQGYESFKRNAIRIAEVWMDDHKKYFYRTLGNDLGNFGDVTDRKTLRSKLNCQSFKWYLENIYPELINPDDGIAQGWIQSLPYKENTCLDGHRIPDRPVNVAPCQFKGGSQYWMYTMDGELRRDDLCMDYFNEKIVLRKCFGKKRGQFWEYRQETKDIYHKETNMCLTLTESKTGVELAKCQDRLYQKWVMETINKNSLPNVVSSEITTSPSIPANGANQNPPVTVKVIDPSVIQTTTVAAVTTNVPVTTTKAPETTTTKAPPPTVAKAPEITTVKAPPPTVVKAPETTTTKAPPPTVAIAPETTVSPTQQTAAAVPVTVAVQQPNPPQAKPAPPAPANVGNPPVPQPVN